MRLLIASDIHGSALYCNELIKRYKEEKAERIILLGDILYHGPRNDLPDEYGPKEVIKALNSLKDDIICVRGNCDTEVDQTVLDFPIMADYALIVADGITLFATHGHKYNTEKKPPLHSGDVLLCGHTHIPAKVFFDNNVYINPGSVSIPKGGSARGYIIFQNGVFDWKTLKGETFDRFDYVHSSFAPCN